MGRGDIKTRKGKRTAGSFGNSRPSKKKVSLAPKAEAPAKGKKASKK